MNPETDYLKTRGLYRLKEAVRIINLEQGQPDATPLTTNRLKDWIQSGTGGLRYAETLSSTEFITFPALVSLRLIQQAHNREMPLVMINREVRQLKLELEADWPLVKAALWSDGHDGPSSTVKQQLRWPDHRPHGLEFDEEGDAIAWTPAEGIKLYPGIMGGRPCIAGTRIPAWVISEMVESGDTVLEVAEDYDITEEKVQQALDWQRRMAAAVT